MMFGNSIEKNYGPNNAILVVGGAVSTEQVKALTEKWFGPIPPITINSIPILKEPTQEIKRQKEIYNPVPTAALFKAYKMPGKKEPGYLHADLLSDLLGFGKSSILEQRLVKSGKLFASIGAYILGSIDPGLLVFSGKMESGINAKEAEIALDEVVGEFLERGRFRAGARKSQKPR